jgi:hypothetical protein
MTVKSIYCSASFSIFHFPSRGGGSLIFFTTACLSQRRDIFIWSPWSPRLQIFLPWKMDSQLMSNPLQDLADIVTQVNALSRIQII